MKSDVGKKENMQKKRSRLYVATQVLSLLIESSCDCHRSRLRFRGFPSPIYSSHAVQGL